MTKGIRPDMPSLAAPAAGTTAGHRQLERCRRRLHRLGWPDAEIAKAWAYCCKRAYTTTTDPFEYLNGVIGTAIQQGAVAFKEPKA